MRIANLVVAGVLLAPSLALGQTKCDARRHDDRVLGTLIGAGVGAVLGNLAASRGGELGGTLIGGGVGAGGGYLIGAASTHCGSNAYGRWDDKGRWIPNQRDARGYYGPDGRWVDDPQRAVGAASVPAADAPDYVEANLPRRADADPGSSADTRDREAWLGDRIIRAEQSGALTARQSRHATRDLDDIRQIEAFYRSDGGRMTPEQTADINARLDALRARLFADDRPAAYARAN